MWITHRAKFEQAALAFPEWVNPKAGVLKAMIEL